MKRTCFLLALGVSILCCSAGPPVRSATGELIESVSYEERSPRSSEGEVKLTGDKLRTAVELMDRAQLTGMSGDFQSTERGDKDSLVITIVGAGNRARKIVVNNCAEVHVCGFFAAAMKSDLVDKPPAVCRDGIRCAD